MPKRSAGILLYRRREAALELLLVHPGGPFWSKKDRGAWSIPKGEYEPGEVPLQAAIREFAEELGAALPATGQENFIALGEVAQPSRKVIAAWAVEGDFDPRGLKPGLFEMEWPPHSGRVQSFPEIDRVEWFTPDEAKAKILPGQRPFIDRLLAELARR
jgi:predicted NUDIX family NTP pyrophosphohydrolase